MFIAHLALSLTHKSSETMRHSLPVPHSSASHPPTHTHTHIVTPTHTQVQQDYESFIKELTSRFPHEASGIRGFYDECWRVFNALNVLELKSLEEIRYLMGQFVRHPLECLTLAGYATLNAGRLEPHTHSHTCTRTRLNRRNNMCVCVSSKLAGNTARRSRAEPVRAKLSAHVNDGVCVCVCVCVCRRGGT